MNESSTKLEIRPVEELDIEDIAGIDEKIGGEYRPEVWENRIFYYIRRDAEASLVALADRKVVGFMLGEIRAGEFGMEEPTGWVEVLGVDPEYRGRNVGRELAETMWRHFRDRGATEVRTLVSTEMGEIEAFFRSLGFEEADMKALVLEIPNEG